MRSHSLTCHPSQVSASRLNPSQTGRCLIYLPGKDERLSWFWFIDWLHLQSASVCICLSVCLCVCVWSRCVAVIRWLMRTNVCFVGPTVTTDETSASHTTDPAVSYIGPAYSLTICIHFACECEMKITKAPRRLRIEANRNYRLHRCGRLNFFQDARSFGQYSHPIAVIFHGLALLNTV